MAFQMKRLGRRQTKTPRERRESRSVVALFERYVRMAYALDRRDATPCARCGVTYKGHAWVGGSHGCDAWVRP
jgi:hypothetical protein